MQYSETLMTAMTLLLESVIFVNRNSQPAWFL